MPAHICSTTAERVITLTQTCLVFVLIQYKRWRVIELILRLLYFAHSQFFLSRELSIVVVGWNSAPASALERIERTDFFMCVHCSFFLYNCVWTAARGRGAVCRKKENAVCVSAALHKGSHRGDLLSQLSRLVAFSDVARALLIRVENSF